MNIFFIYVQYFLLHPVRVVKYCDEYVCLSVCVSVYLSVHTHNSKTMWPILL